MFEFESKPIQITEEMVLCQDGSIWARQGFDSYFQAGCHKNKEKTQKKECGYSDSFEEFWNKWKLSINNTCSKHNSNKNWEKLKLNEKVLAIASIEVYSRENKDHQFLKRADTYLSGKIWESLTSPAPIKKKEEHVPDMNINLKGSW